MMHANREVWVNEVWINAALFPNTLRRGPLADMAHVRRPARQGLRRMMKTFYRTLLSVRHLPKHLPLCP